MSSKTVTTVSTSKAPKSQTPQKKGTKRPRPGRKVKYNYPNGSTMIKKPKFSVSSIINYVATLNDPFEYAGIRMGFGTLVPTGLAMAYYRGSVVVNATDGTFEVVTLPFNCSSGGTNGTLGAVANGLVGSAPSYTGFITPNLTSLTNQFNSIRVVSGGMRGFIRYPKTAQAGVMYACSTPSNSVTAATASVTSLMSNSTTTIITGDSAAVLYRPTDIHDFTFNSINSYSAAASTFQGYIFGTGYPAGSIFYFEVVYHLEGLAAIGSTNAMDDAPSTGNSILSDAAASIEQLYSKIRSSVTPELVDLGKEFIHSRFTRDGSGFRAATVSQFLNLENKNDF